MMEILILIVVIPGIAAYARGRGASPWIAGTVALGGHVLIRIAIGYVGRSTDALIVALVASYAWLAAVAAYYRFMVGRSRPQPTGIWLCRNCSYTNKAYALSCEACGKPWETPVGA